MEIADVVKGRALLREMTHTIKVWDKDTQAESMKTVPYPIAIEFDNSMAVSENCDCVFWNDKDGFILSAQVNNGQTRGANFAVGNDKITNGCLVQLIDYAEIQQLRVVCDEEGLEKVLNAAMANGNFKAAIENSEITINSNMINRCKELIFKQIDTKIIPPVSKQYVK